MSKMEVQPPPPPDRVFLLGAGFSKAVGIPVSAEVPAQLTEVDQELHAITSMEEWVQMAAAVFGCKDPSGVNIEMVFETMYLRRELQRMYAHLDAFDLDEIENHPEVRKVETVIYVAYEALMKLLVEKGEKAVLDPLRGWADSIRPSDWIATFNYDLVCERVLRAASKSISLRALPGASPTARLLKLHGSVDWIRVQHGRPLPDGCEVLYDPFTDINYGFGPANPPTKDEFEKPENYCIVRSPSIGVTRSVIRDFQPPLHTYATVGFSRSKEPGGVAGLGAMWMQAIYGLRHCSKIIAIGFSLSPFDGLARHAIASVMGERRAKGMPDPKVFVVDPNFDRIKEHYERVFGVAPEKLGCRAEKINWGAV